MKFIINTLGCKVNTYETDAMEQLLKQYGYEIVSFEDVADVYVVNTCTVTNMSDRKSRQILRRAKEINPNSIIVLFEWFIVVSLYFKLYKYRPKVRIINNK